MTIHWSVVTAAHVEAACREYDAGARPVRDARNTFLLVGGRRYPAKFIRGIAYRVATGRVLDPSIEYSGGLETVNFFLAKGFAVEYRGEVRTPRA